MLPKEEQTKPEEVYSALQPIHSAIAQLTQTQDVPYLTPLIREIEAELKERDDLEAMVVKKK